MKNSERCYAMAGYFRAHGFSPFSGYNQGPRCFLGALSSETGQGYNCQVIIWLLKNIVGIQADTLIREGWTKRDAIAVCEIAGDIWASEGL